MSDRDQSQEMPVDEKEKAFEGHKAKAEQGDVTAQFELAGCYGLGNGVQKDLKKAFIWYKKAADQELTAAQWVLGVCYEYGKGVEKDLKQAIDCYRKAVDQGHRGAQFSLGKCYHKGIGVETDVKKAIGLYRESADKGYPHAQIALGQCYQTGEGVEKDLKEAAVLFRKGRAAGFPSASYAAFIGLNEVYDGGGERNLKEWVSTGVAIRAGQELLIEQSVRIAQSYAAYFSQKKRKSPAVDENTSDQENKNRYSPDNFGKK